MQGNADYNNKEFIDQSWSEMRSLLDQSLPVDSAGVYADEKKDKRKHRAALLWLLSGMLLLTSSAAVLFAYMYKSVIPQVTEVIKEKIVYKEVIKEVFVPQAEVASTSAKKTKVAPASFSHSDVTEAKAVNSNASLNPETTNSTMLSQRLFLEQEDATELSLVEAGIADAEKTEHTISKTLSLEDLDYSLEISEVEVDMWFAENAVAHEPITKRGLKFNVGVMMTSSRDFDFTGMGITSGVQMPITKRLDLNTGLAVSYMNQAHYFVPAFHRSPSEDKPKSLAEYYFNGLKSLKQVSLPLSLDYSLTKRLAINSGVNLRYTYVEKIDNNLQLPRARPSARAVPNDPESLFNNANFGLSAGLKYRFSPHISILLNSEWAMSSIINKNQFENPSQVQYDLNVINFRTNFTF